MNKLDLYIADKYLSHQIDLLRFTAGEQNKTLALLKQMQVELKAKLRNGLTDFSKARVNKVLKEAKGVIDDYYKAMAPVTVKSIDPLFGYKVKMINKKPKHFYGKHFPDTKILEIYTKGRTAAQIQETLIHETGHIVDYKRRGIVTGFGGDSIRGWDGKLRAAMDSDIYFRDNRLLEAKAIRKVFPRGDSAAITQKEIYADAYKFYISDPKKLKDVAPRIFKEIDDFAIKENIVPFKGKSTDMLALAQNEAQFTANTFAGIGLDASLPSEAALKALVNGSLIEGAQSSAWWSRQSEDLQFKFANQVRQGIVQNETLQQIIHRVAGSKRLGIPGIMDVSRRNASALVHTSIMQVANDSRMATFKANDDIIKGMRFLATLDSHTSLTCIAHSGAEWDMQGKPIAGNLPFASPPLHFNCRSMLVPITLSYRELGIAVDKPKGTRASDLGQIPSDTTFSSFLKRHDAAYVDDLLGPGRAKLWRDGKITLNDLLGQTGRPLTLEQLKKK